ncbi:hypothetical protein [Cryptosporidium parvum Iowa II]|uniref:Uncharacterized protein n=2 Tax=Cryptosporidium parvum TaxID=5807 RepID=Q5CQN7_CRYPI|nr:hypothetical protein [Cryptosporidium parvum Iowa II]EAK87741.1 hypothetical protein cgd4_3910 [Cryptosporidium parvum Iowa II]QOY42044.1 Uncharacterized protein CPATCC_0018670 [Cryptosporidium parvum]WKS77347.1 hypothetical protein CPCDC_4g3910 [Cryptosporidium sp. 43IA8]|eukprot:QOY42044.1 hypothetical protein CPATCC_001642 [Cryptosporidium parvum]
MIDPASAFCVGVYFLGVGVVGSVLYIPISLMRAIEYYHLDGDRRKNKRNTLLDGDSFLQNFGNIPNNNNGPIAINGNNSRNSNNQSICDDNSSLFFERPELLLIHKKKVLRDMLNGNNYLNNLVDFDDKSDYSFGAYERFTTYQNSTLNNDNTCNIGRSRSDLGNSRKYISKYRNSIIHGHESVRDILSTTTPSDKDENDNQLEIVIDDESAIFSLEYFKQIGFKKDYENHTTNYNSMYVCSSTNSTSSIISYEVGNSNHNINFPNRRGEFINDCKIVQVSQEHYSCVNTGLKNDDRDHHLKQKRSLSVSLNDAYFNKIKESAIIEEISAVHDILAL